MKLFLKNMIKQNSLFRSWLLSYIAIFIVPVFFSAIIYIQSGNALELEIYRSNQSILKQVQQSIDSRLRDIETTGRQIAFSTRVMSALSVKGPFGANDQYNLVKLKDDIASSRFANGLIDYIYIYFKNGDSVLGIDSMSNAELFYSLYQSKNSMTYEQWYSLMHKPHLMGFYPLVEKVGGADSTGKIMYVLSLPLIHSDSPNGTLVETMDISKFKEIMQGFQWINQGNLLIVDKESNVLVSTKTEEGIGAGSLDQLKDEQNLVYSKFNGEEYAISFMTSQVTAWKYVFIIPYRIFWQKIVLIRTFSILCLVISILVSAITAYIFTKRNYNPIQYMIKTFSSKHTWENNENVTKFNEYRILFKNIDDTLTEKEAIEKKLEQQKVILRNSFLTRLLNGDSNLGPIHETLSTYNIQFKTDRFLVFLIYIDNIGSLVLDNDGESIDKKLDMIKFILSNVIESIVNKRNLGFVIEIDCMQACIVNILNDESEIEAHWFPEVVDEAQRLLNEHIRISIKASISNIHQNIDGIATAYRESQEAMEYLLISDNRQVVQYEDIKHPVGIYNYSFAIEQKLSSYIKAGDDSAAKDLLNTIFKESFTNTNFSMDTIRCLMFDIVSTIIKTTDRMSDVSFLENLQPIKRLQACKSIKEMNRQITEMITTVCGYVHSNNQKDHRLSDNIVEFIKQNYSDMNLDINMIGKRFDRGASYLSTLFKNQTGENLLDCINKIRLDQAKLLLKQDSLNIQEIARLTGYSNSSVFIRNFRKYEGITPGRFKSM